MRGELLVIMDRIALVLAIIGGINWGSVGLFRFDIRKGKYSFPKTCAFPRFFALYKSGKLDYLIFTAYPIGLSFEDHGSYLYPTTLF